MDVTQVLLTILLVLLAIVGVGLVVALALAIRTVLEIFALARAVRKEVATVGTALRAVGEGIGGKLGFLEFLRPAAKPKPRTRKKA